MQDEEQKLIEDAERYIKEYKRDLIARFANSDLYLPDNNPVSLFMAGSPGAGKTEVSKRLIEQFTGNLPMRIDADEIRELFPNYTGANSHIFQRACSIGVNKLFDYAMEHNINVILDGTFAYERARENIDRSLKHNRRVIIWYLFQDPAVAWRFAKIREAQEGRRVSREVFISAFMRAMKNVEEVKSHFGTSVELNMIIKDFTKDFEEILLNIEGIDKHIPKRYTQGELEQLLHD